LTAVDVDLRELPAEEAPVRRFVQRLWLPYHRELEATVADHELADGVDLVEEEVPFRLDRLDAEAYRLWVAADDPLASTEADLAGFVATDVDRSPSVFDRPDRLVVDDVYVRERYRGTDLATELVGRAAERAGEAGCEELVLDVDPGRRRDHDSDRHQLAATGTGYRASA
jgi:GNAT superfamily N-acetyltransferase